MDRFLYKWVSLSDSRTYDSGKVLHCPFMKRLIDIEIRFIQLLIFALFQNYFRDLGTWLDRHTTMNESANFLIEMCQEDVTFDVKQQLLLINRRWKEVFEQSKVSLQGITDSQHLAGDHWFYHVKLKVRFLFFLQNSLNSTSIL